MIEKSAILILALFFYRMHKDSYLFRPFWLLLPIFLWACQQKTSRETLFSLVPSKVTGITFKNLLKETEVFNVLKYGYFYNGGGVAIGDINNDGLQDIYFTGNMVASRLYLNQGNWKFKEIADPAGVAAAGLWNTGVTMADVNGDGFLDIYVCRSAAVNPQNRRNLLFINNQDLTFSEHAETFALADPGYSTQAAFFDYDRDGDLDMYLLNHSVQEYAGFSNITANLKHRFSQDHGDKLYRNDQVLFTDVSRGAGIKSNVLGFGLGIGISDLNQDGWPDIYISNDYNEQDYLYINNKDGTFTDRLEEYVGHVSLFSMGSDIGDINNDGFPDIMTLDMLPESNYRQKLIFGPDNYEKFQKLQTSGFYHQSMRNMLQLNLQGKGFSEIGQISGVSNTDWSWAALFADFDNDGFKDLFVTNGYQRDYTNMDFMNYLVSETMKRQGETSGVASMETIEKMPAIMEPNYIFQNQGDLSFHKQNEAWGITSPSLSNGAAYGDLDNDGDLDLVVNNINEVAHIYENHANEITGNHYVGVRLVGKGANTKGIGAKVVIHCGGQSYSQEQIPTRGFQSSVSQVLNFGIGNCTMIDSLSVFWPDSTMEVLSDLPADSTYSLNQNHAKVSSPTSSAKSQSLFSRIRKPQPSLVHRENAFVDFKRERLLPHKLSTEGPGIAVADLNRDGLDDLYLGGARGYPGKILMQTKEGEFQKTFQTEEGFEDVEAAFFDADGDLDLDLYVVSGGHEFDPGDPWLQDRLYLNDNGSFVRSKTGLPAMLDAGSCVEVTDVDNDGDFDLFVGGRSVPGNYPEFPRSYLLVNQGSGIFEDQTAHWNQSLVHPGMVTDALWVDYDQNGYQDLVIVGEWMPIRVFAHNGQSLNEVTEDAGLSQSAGWWNCIEAADLDEDGDQDLVAGNFGYNAQITASPSEPVTLYVSDFDHNGTIDPILNYYIDGVSYPAFSKDDLEQQIPMIKKKYQNYKDYANQTMAQIFDKAELEQATVLSAFNLGTSVIKNTGSGRFEITPLPLSAQVAPVYTIHLEDLNSDQRPDILLAGNFLGSRVKFGNYDASRGVLLLQNDGEFQAASNSLSGLWLEGEIRDMAKLRGSNGNLFVFAVNNDTAALYFHHPPVIGADP